MPKENLKPLNLDDFAIFYEALYGYAPFQWQQRLAEQVCRGNWPEYIKLPTASGKTAAVDIAVFAMAYQAAASNRVDGTRTAPRRVFFVVDRRIIVNEAYRRARAAAKKLRRVLVSNDNDPLTDSHRNVLMSVANWLRVLAADDHAPPLDCFELRGGIYRNDAWVRSPLQPTVLTSTVDQVGSRLLFRGYGVPDRSLSIHAALTANDSLIVLDEAHCSKPFSQTMKSIERYRGDRWAEQVVESPFQFVQMTATPPIGLDGTRLFGLTNEDYERDEKLTIRHQCSKPIRLVSPVPGAKTGTGAGNSKIAKKLVAEATSLAKEHGLKKVAIVVNRVDIARQAFAELERKHRGRVHLMIGRMRPIDRDKLTRDLQREFGSRVNADVAADTTEPQPQFVVATQCLEVGADLDFDGMVSQCASLDALRQRFGRLNRLGNSPLACGTIVTGEGDVPSRDKLDPEKPLDPVYGNALANTWHWLDKVSTSTTGKGSDQTVREVDFGISQLDRLCEDHHHAMGELLAPALDAPVLMPAHMDMFCQTSPRPKPEPNVADYLHGPDHGQREVRVCWRADLDVSGEYGGSDRWLEAVEHCPPSSAECLSVPIGLLQKWLRGEAKLMDDTSDVLSETVTELEDDKKARFDRQENPKKVLIWRGKPKRSKDGEGDARSFVADAANYRRIRPNDTIVIPTEFGGWSLFGHVPNAPAEPKETADSESLFPSHRLPDEQPSANEALLPSPRKRGEGLGVRGSSDESEMLKSDAASIELAVNELALIDVAEPAFLHSRARTIWRIHPKLNLRLDLNPNPEAKPLWDALLAEFQREPDNQNLALSRWRKDAKALAGAATAETLVTGDDDIPSLLMRLTDWGGEVGGKIVSYPGGLVWTTDRHKAMTESMQRLLPLPTFGDDDDTLSLQGKVTLLQHLSDVYQEASRLAGALDLPDVLESTVLESAKLHDLGKADPRFQAMLLGKPLSTAFMQQQLWAKSESYSRFSNSELPTAFRHEMLSLSLLEHSNPDCGNVDDDLLKHEIASHHGFARPFAPFCDDPSPPGLNLASLHGPTISQAERKQWVAAHRLDSGIADRFWTLTHKYGWWGLAFLESILRLADWSASANPVEGEELSLKLSPRTHASRRSVSASPLVLTGLDGSNPLAFLAALGLFRVVSSAMPPAGFRLSWERSHGAWRPAISAPHGHGLTEESLLDLLGAHLCTHAGNHPALRLADRLDSVSDIRQVFDDVAAESAIDDRTDTDWLSCNGSDIAGSENISQLQTTRRDYHSINMRGLISETTPDHLARSLFEAWDYADPIAGVSLHLEPREDRRHAYQWHMPSGDPTRKIYGGMMGANRLALEAWPLFQSLPHKQKLITVGFRGTRASDTQFSWPIWSTPVTLSVIPSLLSLGDLHKRNPTDQQFEPLGIAAVFRCSRILVGKTPNLTASVAVCDAHS